MVKMRSMFRYRIVLGRARPFIAACVLFIFAFLIYVQLSPLDAIPTQQKARQLAKSDLVRAIPKIIHQSYKSERIPRQYWDSVRSWRRRHPEYEYFLWTDEDIDRFIKQEYPEFFPLFQSYSHKLQKVDAVRYFILYHYGGVYADMDMDALKPLDPLIARHSCIISRERYAQTMFLWSQKESLMNCIMASSPRHPFMKFVMSKLPNTASSTLNTAFNRLIRSSKYILTSTGPLALTEIFYDYKPCRQNSLMCDVYLSEPEELLPTLKDETLAEIRSYCTSWLYAPLYFLSPWRRLACYELERVNYRNRIVNSSFTDHKFSNHGYQEGVSVQHVTKHISELVGQFKRF